MPPDVVEEFLEDFTTHIMPQAPITVLTTTLNQRVDAKLEIGLGVTASIIILTVVILSISVCIVYALYRKNYKRFVIMFIPMFHSCVCLCMQTS